MGDRGLCGVEGLSDDTARLQYGILYGINTTMSSGGGR